MLVHVFIEDEEIVTTEDHPFYVEDIGFVSAGELRCGDTVRLADGRKVPVKQISLEYLDEPVAVYNFEVEDFHTYYVSELGVLLHNMYSKMIATTGGGADFYVGSDGTAARSLDGYDKHTKKFDNWLNKGKADNKVYFGMRSNKSVYTGITKPRLTDRIRQHNNPGKGKIGKGFSHLEQQYGNLTRNQARAIEQYYIENGPNAMNKINSISPKSKYYHDALNWAKKYIDSH